MKIQAFKLTLTAVLTLVFAIIQIHAQWVPTNNPGFFHPYPLEVSPDGSLYTSSNGLLYRTTDGGNTWLTINFNQPQLVVNAIAFNSEGHIFVSTYPEGISRSIDTGATWQTILTRQGRDMNKIAVNTIGEILIPNTSWELGHTLLISSDNGNTWTEREAGWGFAEHLAFGVNSLNHIYAGAAYGIFRSEDNGLSWGTVCECPYTFRNMTIRNDNVIFIAPSYTFEGIMRSDSSGNIWEPVLTVNQFNAIDTDAASLVVYAASDEGVIRSADNGESWGSINEGLTDHEVNELAVGNDGFLYAATDSLIWKYDLTVNTSGFGLPDYIAADNPLIINPNPAINEINVHFSMKISDPEYHIFSLDGKLAASGYLNTTKNATVNQTNARIDISTLKSGNYIIVVFDNMNSIKGRFVIQ